MFATTSCSFIFQPKVNIRIIATTTSNYALRQPQPLSSQARRHSSWKSERHKTAPISRNPLGWWFGGSPAAHSAQRLGMLAKLEFQWQRQLNDPRLRRRKDFELTPERHGGNRCYTVKVM